MQCHQHPCDTNVGMWSTWFSPQKVRMLWRESNCPFGRDSLFTARRRCDLADGILNVTKPYMVPGAEVWFWNGCLVLSPPLRWAIWFACRWPTQMTRRWKCWGSKQKASEYTWRVLLLLVGIHNNFVCEWVCDTFFSCVTKNFGLVTSAVGKIFVRIFLCLFFQPIECLCFFF
jgi:hypothetical protein